MHPPTIFTYVSFFNLDIINFMVLAHSLIGVPITFFVLSKVNLKNFQKFSSLDINLLYFFGIIGAVFPDFDLILTFFIDDLNHRKLISHSLIPYLAIFISVYFLAKTLREKEDLVNLINLIFFLGVFSHLLIDFLVGGISIFAPFSGEVFGFPIYFTVVSDFFYYYFTSWYSFFELLILLVSTTFILKLKNIFIVKYLPIFLFLTAIVMIFLSN